MYLIKVRVAVIEFHLDARSGVAPYRQLIHQVRQALRLGLLREGDQLPKVKDVVDRAGDQPEHGAQGLPGAGIRGAGGGPAGDRDVRDRHAGRRPRWPRTARCAADLRRWLTKARRAGLDDESIEALFLSTFRAASEADIA